MIELAHRVRCPARSSDQPRPGARRAGRPGRSSGSRRGEGPRRSRRRCPCCRRRASRCTAGWAGRPRRRRSASIGSACAHGLDRERARQRVVAAAGADWSTMTSQRPERRAGRGRAAPARLLAVVGDAARRLGHDVRLAARARRQRRARQKTVTVDGGGDAAGRAAAVGGHEDGVELVVLDRPDPAPVGDRGAVGVAEVDVEILVGLGVVIADDGDDRGLRCTYAGREGERALRRSVVARLAGGAVRGPEVDRDLEVLCGSERRTRKTASLVPASPSRTVTSSIENAGRSLGEIVSRVTSAGL